METKDEPMVQNRRPPPSQDIFDMPKKPPSKQAFDPFAMDQPPAPAPAPAPPQKQASQDIFGMPTQQQPPQRNLDPFDMNPAPAPAMPAQNNQDDLDIFFGTPAPAPAPPTQPAQAVFSNKPANPQVVNKNDVSGFSVYNQLNTSNMKDMSVMGINNFLEINKENDKKEAPKFDLRDEPSGTIFDEQTAGNKQR